MRLLGVNIPDQKQVKYSLAYVYGIGLSTSAKILAETKIDPKKFAKDLTQDEQNKLKNFVEKNFHIEGELRQIIRQNVNRLKDLKVYRGVRHARRLPVRGQRTRTNSRTVRGNVRKTAGSGKRKVELK
jgi:small subunit ribosomal protein S13